MEELGHIFLWHRFLEHDMIQGSEITFYKQNLFNKLVEDLKLFVNTILFLQVTAFPNRFVIKVPFKRMIAEIKLFPQQKLYQNKANPKNELKRFSSFCY